MSRKTIRPLSNLAQVRRAAGITQVELARRAGVSRATVSRLELGAEPRHGGSLARVEDALIPKV